MREFWKKTLVMAAVGFAAGMLVGLIFLLPHGIRAHCAEHGVGWIAVHLAVSGLVGAVNMGSTTIYDLEHWGLLRCTLTHFLITMSCLCLIGFSMGWFSLRDSFTLCILAICVLVYFIIWRIMCLRYRSKLRRINEALKTWKDAQGDE